MRRGYECGVGQGGIWCCRVLCETVKEFLAKVSGSKYLVDGDEDDQAIRLKCDALRQKLDSLLRSLDEEAKKAEAVEISGVEPDAGSSSDSDVSGLAGVRSMYGGVAALCLGSMGQTKIGLWVLDARDF